MCEDFGDGEQNIRKQMRGVTTAATVDPHGGDGPEALKQRPQRAQSQSTIELR